MMMIIRLELDLDTAVSASRKSLFKGLPRSRVGPFGLQFSIDCILSRFLSRVIPSYMILTDIS